MWKKTHRRGALQVLIKQRDEEISQGAYRMGVPPPSAVATKLEKHGCANVANRAFVAAAVPCGLVHERPLMHPRNLHHLSLQRRKNNVRCGCALVLWVVLAVYVGEQGVKVLSEQGTIALTNTEQWDTGPIRLPKTHIHSRTDDLVVVVKKCLIADGKYPDYADHKEPPDMQIHPTKGGCELLPCVQEVTEFDRDDGPSLCSFGGKVGGEKRWTNDTTIIGSYGDPTYEWIDVEMYVPLNMTANKGISASVRSDKGEADAGRSILFGTTSSAPTSLSWSSFYQKYTNKTYTNDVFGLASFFGWSAQFEETYANFKTTKLRQKEIKLKLFDDLNAPTLLEPRPLAGQHMKLVMEVTFRAAATKEEVTHRPQTLWMEIPEKAGGES
eukprot:SAG31_NODE_7583_length_1647_cov_4.801034_1_plen_384_part_00